MSFRSVGLAATFLTLMLIVGPGCASSPYSTALSFHPQYFTSLDSVLRYRLPVGWFDATADSQSAGHVIWLLKDDYTSSISVDEIHLDAQAKKELNHDGLVQLARLTMNLGTGKSPAVLQEAPELSTLEGKEICSYELVIPPSNDILRTVLLNVGPRTYAVNALVAGEDQRIRSKEVFEIQRGFLGNLHW